MAPRATEVALPQTVRRSSESRWLLVSTTSYAMRSLAERKNVGGKAARLAWLRMNGFLVPQAWVLSQKAFASAIRQLSPACEPRTLLRAASGRAVYARAADARQGILHAPMPEGLEEELGVLWRAKRPTHRGASPFGRARPARTERWSRWPASPRRSSASEAPTRSRTRCAPSGRRSPPDARSATSRRTAYATSDGRRHPADGARRRGGGDVHAQEQDGPRTSASSTPAWGSARRSSTASPRPTCSASARDGIRNRAGNRAKSARNRRRSGGPRGIAVKEPDEPALSVSPCFPSPRSRRSSRSSRTCRGTSSSHARASASGSCRHGTSPASGSPKAATRTRSGAAATSVRRCPASPPLHVVRRRRVQRIGLPQGVRHARMRRPEERRARR